MKIKINKQLIIENMGEPIVAMNQENVVQLKETYPKKIKIIKGK